MKNLWVVLILLLGTIISLQAQSVGNEKNGVNDTTAKPQYPGMWDEEFFKYVEDMPDYPGGEMAMMTYLSSVKYPEEALKGKFQGTTYISFIIEKDGGISNAMIVRSSNYEVLDNAALEHIKAMPNWKPGTQRGETVRVQYVIPIKFKL